MLGCTIPGTGLLTNFFKEETEPSNKPGTQRIVKKQKYSLMLVTIVFKSGQIHKSKRGGEKCLFGAGRHSQAWYKIRRAASFRVEGAGKAALSGMVTMTQSQERRFFGGKIVKQILIATLRLRQ